MAKKRKPNILLIGVDSLRADHLSCYGYPRQTSPHIDRFAQESTLFENTFSAYIPTTSGYGAMLTGMDVITSQVIALRHKGPMRAEVKTLPEILHEAGYNTTCVGFNGNPSSRGFDKYLEFSGWGSWNDGRSTKAQNLNDVTIPELERLASKKQPFFLFLRHMDLRGTFFKSLYNEFRSSYDRINGHLPAMGPAEFVAEEVLYAVWAAICCFQGKDFQYFLIGSGFRQTLTPLR